MVYSHEWDETKSFFLRLSKTARNYEYKQVRAGSHIQVMVQRGTVNTQVTNLESNRRQAYTEEWLVEPLTVAGVAARNLYPALLRGVPSLFSWEDMEALKALASSV